MSDEDRAHPPTPIAMKLGNTGAWQHWVDTELRESLRLRRSCCETALYLPCMLALACVPCLCSAACQQHRLEVERLDRALRDWQARFNAQVLVAQGLFVKTQSMCTVHL